MNKILSIIYLIIFNVKLIKFSKLWIVSITINPILITFITLFILTSAGKSPTELTSIVFCAGFFGIWSVTLTSASYAITAERNFGTLEILLATPTSLSKILFTKIISSSLTGFVSFLISILTSYIIFNIPITIQHPIEFIILLILTIISMAIMGYLLSVLVIFTRSARGIMNFLEYPIYLISGLIIPISFLPLPLKVLGYIYPPTWGINAIKLTFYEKIPFTDFAINISILIIFNILIYILSSKLYKITIKKSQKDGRLGLI